MIQFTRKVGRSEREYNYLNLTDANGNTYGSKFPPERTPLWIETSGNRYKASMKGPNQIWGELVYWFDGENVTAGSTIEIVYDPEAKTIDGRILVSINILSRPEPQAQSDTIAISKEEVSEGEAVEVPLKLEQDLEDFLLRNLTLIEPGLTLYVDENNRPGRQYPTEVGEIDILARKRDELVVIELKKGRSSDPAVGQISRYIGWVKDNLTTNKESVRGIMIVHDFDPKLKYAVAGNPNLQLKYYELQLKFIDETAAASKAP